MAKDIVSMKKKMSPSGQQDPQSSNKKRKVSGTGENSFDSNEKQIEATDLPPELWSHVVNFLYFEDALNCTSVSRFFLRDVPRHVKQLSIFNGNVMKVSKSATDRFSDVTFVSFHPLAIEEYGDGDADELSREWVKIVLRGREIQRNEGPFGSNNIFDCNTARLAIPFIIRFPKLIEIDGLWDGNYDLTGFVNVDDGTVVRAYATLLQQLCKAYRKGDISEDVDMGGMDLRGRCLSTPGHQCVWKLHQPEVPSYRTDVPCQMCDLICASFPPIKIMQLNKDDVPCIDFENRLRIARFRNPETFKFNLTESLHLMSTKLLFFWDTEEHYENASKLIECGANAKDPRIRDNLMVAGRSFDRIIFRNKLDRLPSNGKRSITSDIYEKWVRLGFEIKKGDFNVLTESYLRGESDTF